MKKCSPSLVNAVITNKSQYCLNPINFGCGISDLHNKIGVLVKGTPPPPPRLKNIILITEATKNLIKGVSTMTSVRWHFMQLLFLKM